MALSEKSMDSISSWVNLEGTGDFSIALWFKSTSNEEQVLIQQRDQNNYIG